MTARQLAVEHQEARLSLPWWAQSGPCYLCADGSYAGAEVGWPAIEDAKPSESGARILIRPNKSDLGRLYEVERNFGPERALATYRARRQSLARRLRARRQEERKVGLPMIEATMDRNTEAGDAIEAALAELPATLPWIAAMHMLEMTADSFGSDEVGRCAVLAGLRPLLTAAPVVAATVDDLLSSPRRPIRETPIWMGLPRAMTAERGTPPIAA